MSLAKNLLRVQNRIQKAIDRSGVKRLIQIVAVTKTHPPQTIRAAYQLGLQTIGENRVQEAAEKFPVLQELPGLCKRMIGHLQSNKAKKAVALFDTIDTVDSISLARKIGSYALAANKSIPVLLEVNTSGEKTKDGFSEYNLEELYSCLNVDGIKVTGLMTIGPLKDKERNIRNAFIRLRRVLEKLNNTRPGLEPLTDLSMGMSSDFEIAIEEGSTMVRLGSCLFGPRAIPDK